MEALTGKRDFDKAKKLIAEAGYKGEKIVVLDGTDQPPVHAQALVVADLMKLSGSTSRSRPWIGGRS